MGGLNSPMENWGTPNEVHPMKPVKPAHPFGAPLIVAIGIGMLFPLNYFFGIGGKLLDRLVGVFLYFPLILLVVFGLYGLWRLMKKVFRV
jgi:hypothetical protein